MKILLVMAIASTTTPYVGRVLRALLARRLVYLRATKIAGLLGQGMALLFGLAGLFGNPFLLFIALFVWIGAAQESAAVEAKSALGNVPVGSAMITDFRHLSPTVTRRTPTKINSFRLKRCVATGFWPVAGPSKGPATAGDRYFSKFYRPC